MEQVKQHRILQSTILNLNDNAPVITSTCSPCTADENQTADIYTMDATDADGSTLYWGLRWRYGFRKWSEDIYRSGQWKENPYMEQYHARL
jgi:hypothetical protein